MSNKPIPNREFGALIFVTLMSNNVTQGLGLDLQQDSWIALLLSLLLIIPQYMMFARINTLLPGIDVFEKFEFLFGKNGGRIFSLLFVIYGIFVCAFGLMNFAELIQIVALFHTPIIVIAIMMFIPAIYLAKSGGYTVVKWSFCLMITSLLFGVILMLVSIQQFRPDYLLPVMGHPPEAVIKGAVKLTMFPFGEMIFISSFSNIMDKGNKYKFYLTWGMVCAGLLLSLFLHTILIIGPETFKSVYLPAYRAATIIHIGSFVQRIESLVIFFFLLMAITKAGICLHFTSKAIAKTANIKSYKDIVTAVGIAAAALCAVLATSYMEFISLLDVYRVFSVPFQIVIPLLVMIAAEIKTRKNKTDTVNALKEITKRNLA